MVSAVGWMLAGAAIAMLCFMLTHRRRTPYLHLQLDELQPLQDGLQALATAPDIAIVDYSLPLLNGVEVTRQIRQRSPHTEVIIFTMYDNDSLIHDLLNAGALGYLLKTDAKRLLMAAVESVAQHKPFFTGIVSEALLQAFMTKGMDSPLTARELGQAGEPPM